MSISRLHPPITGEALKIECENSFTNEEPIIEGILYKHDCLMFFADPGAGKSYLVKQLLSEISSGTPVFGHFPVPQPKKVLYIQAERSRKEIERRLHSHSKYSPVNWDNIFITDGLQGLNILKENDLKDMIEYCITYSPDSEVIIIDPIYKLAPGGVEDGNKASTLVTHLEIFQKTTKSSLIINHHTTKEQYDRDGNPIKKSNSFYGSQWLLSHVTGAYFVDKTDVGRTLRCKKDNNACLTPTIPLHYNSDTDLLETIGEKMSSLEKVKHILRHYKEVNKHFYFDELLADSKLSTRIGRKSIVHSSISPHLEVVSSDKNKYLYKVVGNL